MKSNTLLYSQVIQQVYDQFDLLKTQQISSNYHWHNLHIRVKAIDLEDINWTEADYYQSLSGKNSHLHAYGYCAGFSVTGHSRVEQLDAFYKNFIAQCLFFDIGEAKQNNNPIAYCQLAFDEDDPMSGTWQGFDNSKLVIPQLMFFHQAEQTDIIITIKNTINATDDGQLQQLEKQLKEILIKPDSHPISNINPQFYNQEPEKSLWKQQAHQIKQQLKENTDRNSTNKIVLARKVIYQFSRHFNIRQLLKMLLKTYPDCTIIMLKSSKSYLIACSPEVLVKVSEQIVYCDTVGGTIGGNQAQVKEAKLKHEHIIIREHIHQVLQQKCINIQFPEQPSIKNYLHLSHLYTHFSAQAKKSVTVLEMACLLHPTPAVCGFPINTSKQWIKQNETFNRGLYSGFSGWLDKKGEGELNVILRCAVLNNMQQQNKPIQPIEATLYAGAGIVNGSDEEEEWQETELKLSMLLHSLKQLHNQ
ncbi:MAG: isochorismate synthase [Pseudomonadota bacterium]